MSVQFMVKPAPPTFVKVHVAKKTKRKRADTETEVELPCELDDTPDHGSVALESETLGEKKMKKRREAKSEKHSPQMIIQDQKQRFQVGKTRLPVIFCWSM